MGSYCPESVKVSVPIGELAWPGYNVWSEMSVELARMNKAIRLAITFHLWALRDWIADGDGDTGEILTAEVPG